MIVGSVTAALLNVVTSSGADAKPGWLPFFIILAIGAVIVFLYFSMKKQLGRIHFPEDDQPAIPREPDDPEQD